MKFTWREEPFDGVIGSEARVLSLTATLEARARYSHLERTLANVDVHAEVQRSLADVVCRQLYEEPLKAAWDLRKAMAYMEPTPERDTALMMLRKLTDTMEYRSVLERSKAP